VLFYSAKIASPQDRIFAAEAATRDWRLVLCWVTGAKLDSAMAGAIAPVKDGLNQVSQRRGKEGLC
jgi:hypothetical protein